MDIKEELIANLSSYFDAALLKSQQALTDSYQQEIIKLNETHQQEVKSLNDMIERLKTKLTGFMQTEDTNKFQKRTIASLTAEVSTMQTTITSLEKRLKLASEEIRSLKQPGRTDPLKEKQIPILTGTNEPEPSEITETKETTPTRTVPEITETTETREITETTETREITETKETERNEPDEQEPVLIPVMLQSGPYYWEPETNDLYEFISEEEAGAVVGLVKSIKIKTQIYYLDTSDNTFYDSTDGLIGQCMGQIVDRKAVFYRSKN